MFLWLKALHIIALVCWFAALFYLPRLFVYHADADDAPSRERFVLMESRLLCIIAHPAAALSVASGLLLAAQAWDWYRSEALVLVQDGRGGHTAVIPCPAGRPSAALRQGHQHLQLPILPLVQRAAHRAPDNRGGAGRGQALLSAALFARAARRIPGGVNSPVRACGAVGGAPLFAERGEGAWIFDSEGNKYIDYVLSWGPMILGHGDERVRRALQQQLQSGLSFGAPTAAETELAELLCDAVPGMEMVRLVSSGTEACMSALRLARAHSGRDCIVKFGGCYHGHSDALLVDAGSGALACGVPSSPGVPQALAERTLVLPYNDADACRRLFAGRGADIAAIMVEPVAGNMGLVPPRPGFLQTLRRCCDDSGALLIFDEVMSGFRVGPAGAAGLYGVRPDLTTLGKVIGGGLPLAAFGGRADLMEQLAPGGPVYQAGTLSGNPLAVCAGLATLRALAADGTYERLGAASAQLAAGLQGAADAAGVPLHSVALGGMLGLFFGAREPVHNLEQARACDGKAFAKFFHAMLAAGVWWPPSPFEAAFLSLAHDDELIARTLSAAAAAFAGMAR